MVESNRPATGGPVNTQKLTIVNATTFIQSASFNEKSKEREMTCGRCVKYDSASDRVLVLKKKAMPQDL